MERAEFSYPPLGDSSDEAEEEDLYALDVDAMESPIRTPVIIDTSNSFASDNQVSILDGPRQSPDFNLYDNLIEECPQESVEVRCERRETELTECQQVIESLRTQLVLEQQKNKKLSKSLHAALATFRTERNHKEQTIDDLKQRSQRLLAVSCPYCQRGFDANSASTRRPSPVNTRILRGQCVVELKFGDYDTLRSWVLAVDLETNTDGLPTLPDTLANSLLPAKQPQLLSLASSGSRLVQPLEKPSTPDTSTAEESGHQPPIATEIPTEVNSAVPSPPVSLHTSNYRIPKKNPMSPLRCKNEERADSEHRLIRRGDADRFVVKRRSRSRSRSRQLRRRSPSRSRSRERKRSRGQLSPFPKRSRSRSLSPLRRRSPRRRSPRRHSPSRRSPSRRSPSPSGFKHTGHDRQRRHTRRSQRKTLSSPKRSSFDHGSRKRQLSSPKKSLSGIGNMPKQKKARIANRTEADTETGGQNLVASNRRGFLPSLAAGSSAAKQVDATDARREKQSNIPSAKAAERCDRRRLNSSTATRKNPEKDALNRPSLPTTPVPQLHARSSVKLVESPAHNLPDTKDEPLDLDFIREALRVGQALPPKLSPVKPPTPRSTTPLRLALTPRALGPSEPPNEPRTVTPLKISVARPQAAGKGRMSGKLAAMLLMKLEDEANHRSDGEISSDDEAANENDATTTAIDSCAVNARQSAGADRTNIWMNSLRKNFQL